MVSLKEGCGGTVAVLRCIRIDGNRGKWWCACSSGYALSVVEKAEVNMAKNGVKLIPKK